MGIMFAEDIRSQIVTQMTDVTSGIDAQLTAMNSSRSETTPLTSIIDSPYDQGVSWQIFLDIKDSQIETNLGAGNNPYNISAMREVYDMTISTIVKDMDIPTMRLQTERYIEAILRCLQNFKHQDIDGDYFLLGKRTFRTVNDQHLNTAEWEGGVDFEIHKNKL